MLVTVKVNETDMRMWARLYCSQINVVEPKELVDICKQDLLNALALYEGDYEFKQIKIYKGAQHPK